MKGLCQPQTKQFCMQLMKAMYIAKMSCNQLLITYFCYFIAHYCIYLPILNGLAPLRLKFLHCRWEMYVLTLHDCTITSVWRNTVRPGSETMYSAMH